MFVLCALLGLIIFLSSDSFIMYQLVLEALDTCIFAYFDTTLVIIELLLFVGVLAGCYLNLCTNFLNVTNYAYSRVQDLDAFVRCMLILFYLEYM